ncbi:alpha-2,8-polysialyltransferase family protein [Empedobacter falsenii]
MNTLYITNSIFHIIYSFSLIKSKNNKGNNYLALAGSNNKINKEIILKLFSANSELKDVITLIDIPNLKDIAHTYSNDTLNVIKDIKQLNIQELVIFNDDNLLSIYLGQYFSNKNIIVSLAQDGTKTYFKHKSIAPRYCLLRTIEYYKYCKMNDFNYHFHYISMVYGKANYISRLYITNKSAFDNIFDKECIEVKLNNDIVKLYSNTLTSIELDENKPTIFFVSSLLKWNEEQVRKEFSILEILQNNYKDYQLAVKLHPRVSKEIINYYQEKLKWILITDLIPAEAYIINLKKCYMISAYSSAAIFDGDKQSDYKRFWIYPLYGKTLTALDRLIVKNPSDDIKILSDKEELVRF